MVTVRGWKVWYDDLSTYSSNTGLFALAPDDGMAEMYVYLLDNGKKRRQEYNGHDFYFHDDDGLFGSNNDTLEVNQKRYPNCTFKRGKWMHPARFQAIRLTAHDDMEFA